MRSARARHEPRLRGRDLRVVLMSAGGKATTTVEEVFDGRPAHAIGLQPADRILEIDGAPVTPEKITERISGSEGGRADARRPAERRAGHARPGTRPARRGRLPARLRLGAQPSATSSQCSESVLHAVRLTGRSANPSATSSTGRAGADREPDRHRRRVLVGRAARRESYLAVLAFISLSLGLLNLLPSCL